MPSDDQFDELSNSNYTTTKWTTQNGVSGRMITSKINGNSIFLPAAGCRELSSLDYAGETGIYWSRTLSTIYPEYAVGLGIDMYSSNSTDPYDRLAGFSVRPVRQ